MIIECWQQWRRTDYRSCGPGFDSRQTHIASTSAFFSIGCILHWRESFFYVYLPVQLLSFFTRVYKLCQANNRSFSIQSPSLFSQMEPDINGKLLTCSFPKTIQNYVRYYLSNEVRIVLFFVFIHLVAFLIKWALKGLMLLNCFLENSKYLHSPKSSKCSKKVHDCFQNVLFYPFSGF